ncbi:magnesium and cobalt transport protein CorA [Scytonema sp. HK-05]|uniref:magnesium/cobalt transporter CorA n=1 Tax=Scytonema sp. HK-05 TaxID=1137095 RepID=UPI000937068B|nr:magnesium/cobalt transporter CorA [Scytonema sp. HK-05]OKH46288.1 magnesium and cobalt transport protein CorA [Scytonema sp. HK-05]BAY49173.1 magnesium and cobalt transport protein CorA [Scytonema sp. HK-05]
MVRKLRRSLQVVPKPYNEDDFYHQPGTIPGTIIIPTDASPPKITLIDYHATGDVIRKELNTPEECTPYLDRESVSWVEVQGLGDEDILRRLGKVFDLHPLVLEDIVNVAERPKIEEYEDHLVIICRMVVPKERRYGFYSEQVSFVLGKHYLLTVQEEPDHDCLEGVRSRICNNKGTIRKRKADYLAYALLDAIVDGFFPVLERYGEQIEDLEDEVITNPSRQTLQKIYQVRRELLQLRRYIWPQRDAINSLIRDGNELICEEVRIYLRDCYDHTVQVMDMVETYRELASGLMDVYLSAVGNRMNEIMKFLTVTSSIFIPLTFIAGIYGMNFNTEKSPYNMPELNWHWGYFMCLGLMAAIAFVLVFIFWRRGWFQNFSKINRE